MEVPASSTTPTARGQWTEYLRVNEEQGGLISQALAAKLLGISRARVGQLVDRKKLAAWYLLDHSWVSATEIMQRCTATPDRGGRPKKSA
jgi:predicted transcriptional regulator